jgi:hypothetical protein
MWELIQGVLVYLALFVLYVLVMGELGLAEERRLERKQQEEWRKEEEEEDREWRREREREEEVDEE